MPEGLDEHDGGLVSDTPTYGGVGVGSSSFAFWDGVLGRVGKHPGVPVEGDDVPGHAGHERGVFEGVESSDEFGVGWLEEAGYSFGFCEVRADRGSGLAAFSGLGSVSGDEGADGATA
jgi:hypothetical protein